MAEIDRTKRIAAEEIAWGYGIDPESMSDFDLFDLIERLGYVWDEELWSWLEAG